MEDLNLLPASLVSARACVRACMCVCVCVCVHTRVLVCVCGVICMCRGDIQRPGATV